MEGGVVLFPGIPPIQCLSTTIFFFQSIVLFIFIIAFVKYNNSFSFKLFPAVDEQKQAI